MSIQIKVQKKNNRKKTSFENSLNHNCARNLVCKRNNQAFGVKSMLLSLLGSTETTLTFINKSRIAANEMYSIKWLQNFPFSLDCPSKLALEIGCKFCFICFFFFSIVFSRIKVICSESCAQCVRLSGIESVLAIEVACYWKGSSTQ